MAMTMQGFESNASGKNQGFIQDVINFIDQPLSPQSLHKLKKSCKTQGFAGAADEAALAAYHTQQTQQGGVGVGVGTPALAPALSGAVTATADTTGLAVLFPMGTEIEAQHLTNTTEFNGLRGTVVGHVDEKVLVSFHGGSGQVFDIPSYNLRVVASSPRQQSLPTERAPTHETYAPQYPTQTQESITLHAKLRCAMTHVDSARDAMKLATQLHVIDHESLYTLIAEFQPTLSRTNIAKNWAKIIQIYQAHAENVEGAHAQEVQSAASPSYTPVAGAGLPQAQGDVAQNLMGVINFIDSPLSPGSLKEVRTIRHSLSPRRGRSGSPQA